MERFKVTVSGLQVPRRIDVYLAGWAEGRFSRTEMKEALKKKSVLLNGCAAKPSAQVKNGDVVEGCAASGRHLPLEAEERPLKAIFEDEWILVIDKPSGLVVHPGAGNKKGTLANALLGRSRRWSDLGGNSRPGIVHRLDKDTSGLLVVAKNNEAHRFLQAQFEDRTFSKSYLALVKGKIEFDEGRITEPIGRHSKIRRKMAVAAAGEGRDAETHYRVLKRFRYSTLLEVRLLTGRTHQIRVHAARLGHPVIGDRLYGSSDGAPRQMLHAAKIEFIHPKMRGIMRFESPLPEDFKLRIGREEKR